jgi:glycosyltransferase involved in cell wall biosynthesis
LSTPLVSIVLPAYNAEKYIGEAISSVLQQTYNNWHLVIVDDGSTDGTVSIIQKMVGTDKRIEMEQIPHSGLPAVVRNRGLASARGEVIAFLDADDIWAKNKLEVQLAQLPDDGWSFSNSEFFGDQPSLPNGLKYAKDWRPKDPFFNELFTTEGISFPSILIIRSLLESVSPNGDISKVFDTTLGVEDWDLTLRLAEKSEPVYIAQSLARIRQHGAGFSRTYENQYKRTMALITKYENQGAPSSLINKAKRLQLSKRATGRLLHEGGPWRKDLLASCALPPRSLRDIYLTMISLFPKKTAAKLYLKGMEQVRKG